MNLDVWESNYAFPPRIWDKDADIWKAWTTSLRVGYATKEMYNRHIVRFIAHADKSIAEVNEEDLRNYQSALQADGKSEKNAQRILAPIRAYWSFALTNQQ